MAHKFRGHPGGPGSQREREGRLSREQDPAKRTAIIAEYGPNQRKKKKTKPDLLKQGVSALKSGLAARARRLSQIQ